MLHLDQLAEDATSQPCLLTFPATQGGTECRPATAEEQQACSWQAHQAAGLPAASLLQAQPALTIHRPAAMLAEFPPSALLVCSSQGLMADMLTD